jgi:hypothetical protein
MIDHGPRLVAIAERYSPIRLMHVAARIESAPVVVLHGCRSLHAGPLSSFHFCEITRIRTYESTGLARLDGLTTVHRP